MFCIVVSEFTLSGIPVYLEVYLFCAVIYPIEYHLYLFGSFCFIVLLTNLTSMELSDCIGVGGCGWFRLMRDVWMGTTSCVLVYVASILASAADPTTLLVFLQ